jgi:RimJ/RimL family protein N-acetyltransferase
VVLVGHDGDGVACVACVGASKDYSGAYLIELIAVATRMRGGGGIVANEAMNEALDWALNRMDAAGNPAPMVIGDLDPRNTAAAHLLRRHGFQPVYRDKRRAVWTYEPGALPFASV